MSSSGAPMSHSWDLSCDGSSSGNDAFSSFWWRAERWESGMEILKDLIRASNSRSEETSMSLVVVGVCILGSMSIDLVTT